MFGITAARIGRLAVFFLLACIGFSASAASLVVVLDTDKNAATGCLVTTPAGNFAGAEVVLTTTVDTSVNPPVVGAVTQQTCVGAVLGGAVPVSLGGWNVGLGVGVGGYDTVETFIPIGTPPTIYRIGAYYTDGISTDVLFTVAGAVGGAPIIFALPGLITGIPTLSDAGVFLLALLFCIVGARVLHRRQLPTTLVVGLFAIILTTATYAAIVLDGQVGDWVGTPALTTDPMGDAPAGSDISALFVRAENGRIYFRADVKTAAVPIAVADGYSTLAGVPLVVPAGTGVLANDTLGIPSATLTTFGGGNAGGISTTYAAGAVAVFGAGGSLMVNANGSFTFTPAVGFTGPFTFSYVITNPSGSSTGTVAIAVNLAPAFTSANNATFSVGAANTFTVTTTGFPAPAIAISGCVLPPSVLFTNNGNGTATIAGNPPSAAVGTYNCTLTATNTFGAPTQAFTLTIQETPVAFADSYSVAHDSLLTVLVGTGLLSNDTGSPAPTVVSVTGNGAACTVFPCAITTTHGSATVAANGSFTYNPTAAYAGPDSFTYIAGSVAGTSPAATVSITVTNVVPVVDLNGPAGGINFAAAFVEPAPAVAIVDAAQLTVADSDSANLASASVRITNLLDGASESLGYTCTAVAPACQGAITVANVVYVAGTGTLTINGPAPLADFQALLRTVTYVNAAVAPTTTARDIAFTVNDAITDNLPLAHATVTVGAVNNAPTVTVPAPPTATTPTNTALPFPGNVSVADVDAGTSPVKVTLTTTNGTATLSTTAGLTVTGNGTATVVATGPITALNTALNNMQYTPTAAFSGAATLKVDVDDQGNTGTGGALTATATINITVDNPPSVTTTVPANGATSVALGSTIVVNFSEAVTLTGTAFTLQCPVGTPVPFTVLPAGASATFTITPTVPLPGATTCTLTVVANQVTDSIGQNMTANAVITLSTGLQPTVTSTVPANAATGVAPGATITVNFSEPVNATAAAFTLVCGAAQTFTIAPLVAASSFTLTPTAPLPIGSLCNVTVLSTMVTDVDAGQNMAANYPFSFTVATPATFTSANSANFNVGVAGSFAVTTTGGNPTPVLSRTGTLPANLTFVDNGNGTATLSGTPAAGTDAASPYAQNFTATNAGGAPTQAFTLRVCPVISATPGVLPTMTRTNAYTTTLLGSGGSGTYTFAITAGAQPTGLLLSGAGVLSGTPTVSGPFNFTVTVTDTVTACTGTTVYTPTVNDPPVVTNDTYQTVGNTLLEVAAAPAVAGPKIYFGGPGLIANDNDGAGGPAGTGITAVAGTFTNANGSITIATDGTFAYRPNPNFIGADVINYSITTPGGAIGTGTVTITVVPYRVWYVNNAVAPGNGTSYSPFNNLAAAVGASSVSDTIYVFRGDGTRTNQDAGAALKNGQSLVGEGVVLDVPITVNGVPTPVLYPAGLRPTIGNAAAAGIGVNLAQSNTLKGFDINVTGGGNSIAIAGGNVGLLTISSMNSVISAGGAISLNGAGAPAVNVTIGSVTSNGGTNGVLLAGLGGTVNLGTGALTGGSSSTFQVTAGNGNVTYNGSITSNAATAPAVRVNNEAGGTIALTGAVASLASTGGILLTNNAGTTINFSGPLNLATGTTTAFTATGGGTFSATSTGSTITTTTGQAILIDSTTIGTGGLNFQSVSSNGGANDGIYLNNTGTTAGLTVTGDGANTTQGGNSSGGTIANKGGADGSTAAGVCIYLNNTVQVSLKRMTIQNCGNYGIFGTLVTDFTLQYSTVSGTIGTAAGEGAIYFGTTATNGLSGIGDILNNVISGGASRNLSFINTTAAADIEVGGNAIGQNQNAATATESARFEARGGAGTVVTATVHDNTFAGAPSDVVSFNGVGGSQINPTLTNNQINNTHPLNNVGGNGVSLSSTGLSTLAYTGNTVIGSNASGLSLQTAGAGSITGKILNNTIGSVGVPQSGAKTGNGIHSAFAGTGTVTLLIDNNNVFQYDGLAGMWFDNTGGSYTVNLTITNNLVSTTTANPFAGLAITNGAPGADTVNVCADVRTNNFSAGDPADANDIIVGIDGANAGHIFRLPGLVTQTQAAVQALLLANNNFPGTAVTAYSGGPPDTMFVGGPSCPTPP